MRTMMSIALMGACLTGVYASEPGAESGGIQWFATLKTARAEAERTGRPILLISGAPHCAGVSGIW